MIYVAVYLDVDTDGNDLLNSDGSNISAGWYLFKWPLTEPVAGPFSGKGECESSER